MNKRQAIAHLNPCARGKEFDQKFWARESLDGVVMSTMLTITQREQFAHGNPAWHVSVSLLDEKLRVVHADRISGRNRAIMLRTANRLLFGVGQRPELLEEFPLAIHFRRALTAKELADLPKLKLEEVPV
jgi:hypothetical protein